MDTRHKIVLSILFIIILWGFTSPVGSVGAAHAIQRSSDAFISAEAAGALPPLSAAPHHVASPDPEPRRLPPAHSIPPHPHPIPAWARVHSAV